MDSPSLAHRTALVTGASSGLGKALAVGLAHRGATVVAVARRPDALADVIDEIEADGGHATAVAADLADSNSEAILRRVVDAAPIDLLVNAAGMFGPIGAIWDVDPAEWIATIDLNLTAVFRTTRIVAPSMVARGHGTIVNLSSAASLVTPAGGNSAYGVSKVALNTFTRHLAVELEGTGVTANVIHPGDVKTAMFDTIRAEAASSGPLGANYREWVRWMDETGGDPPSKVVDLVVRIATDPNPPTGRFLWIENGLTAPKRSW
ncbi:SDR family oxidoreductase [Humibacter soli]